MTLGPRIRALRQDRSLSVRQLAAEVGVSAATISQVERDINDPSLNTLRRIARALDTPIFDLFTVPGANTPRVIRRDERILAHAAHGEIEYWRISPPGSKVEVLEGVLAPGTASSEEAWAHPAEECAVVLTGALLLEVGDEVHELTVGDSASFDSRFPHRYVNPGTHTAQFIVSVTPPSY